MSTVLLTKLIWYASLTTESFVTTWTPPPFPLEINILAPCFHLPPFYLKSGGGGLSPSLGMDITNV